MIKVIYKSKNSNNVDLIPEIKKGCWVNVVNPDESELKKVCGMLNLDTSIVKDAMDPYEVPRIEVEEGKTYIFTKFPYETTTSTLLIVVENEHVLLFSKEEFPALQKFLDNKVDFCTTQKTKLVIQIFMEINHSFQKRMYDINKSIYQLASKIEKIQNSDIIKFVGYERNLNDYLSALLPVKTTLDMLLSGKYIPLYEEDEDLFEDLSISTTQLIETSKSYLKNIVNIREAYSTILSNNLNKIMKILTSLTVILTIPTIISSFYGMNIPLPYQNNPIAFGVLAIITTGICISLFYFFAKKDLF